MADGLFDPVGRDRPDRSGRTVSSTALIASGVAVVLLAGLLIAAVIRDTGDRGEPVAISTIEHVQQPAVAPAPVDVPPKPAGGGPPPPNGSPAVPATLPAVQADQEVEIQNGVRIIRPRRSGTVPTGQISVVPSTPDQAPDPRSGLAPSPKRP